MNTYTSLGNRGGLMLTLFNVVIWQITTQQSSGGMTELYRSEGTFVKSFYTVMYGPSFTRLHQMGMNHMRLHHKIAWDHAVPCIVGEQWRKASQCEN